MPEIKIPKIKIPTVEIPEIPFYDQDYLTGIIAGCSYYHRDLWISRNPSLLDGDKNGVSTNCPEGQQPHYISIPYEPIKIVESDTPSIKEKEKQETNRKKVIPVRPKPIEEEEEFFKPCPDPNSPLRKGGFANEKRLDRVKEFIRNEEGECIAVWEKVPYIETYFPSPQTAAVTGSMALIAASAPLLLGVIKPAIKNLIKKLTGKKQKSNEHDSKSD
jgi:hypothetical protein